MKPYFVPAAPLGHGNRASLTRNLVIAATFIAASIGSLHAQTPGVALTPYLGWSSFSQQTIASGFLTQQNIMAQSDALLSSGLQAHGYNYINIDSGWMNSFDANGRPIAGGTAFPDFAALVAHVHSNGQKIGLYWIPGIEDPAVKANYPILGTIYHIKDILTKPYTAGNAFSSPGSPPYHYKIDFTKPGAQEYINSIVEQFASWGIDFIKLDGVTPGSYNNDTAIDNRGDVAAWGKAIAQAKHPMWFTISWGLDQDYLSTWQTYANARRIEGDVECEGNCSTLTDWSYTSQRFYDLIPWERASGPTVGWNDLDSLDVGNTATDGLSAIEQQSAVSLWAIANAPVFIGGDLTKLDATGKALLTNDEVIAVDQSGHPGQQVSGGFDPIWVSDQGDGTYYVALFNLNAFPSAMQIKWSTLGFSRATKVRDLWNHIDLSPSNGSLNTTVLGHGVRLFKVTGAGRAEPQHLQNYEAEFGVFGGSASVASCAPCSGGLKVGNIGLSPANTLTFDDVRVERDGYYNMQVDSMTVGPRALTYQVNGGNYQTLNAGGESFLIPASSTVPVPLKAGVNSILFGNPVSYPPDLDRIAISGDGSLPPPTWTAYEAELASFTGSSSASYCGQCSGASSAGNIGGASTVTFNNITVPVGGIYQLEVDYMTSGPRSFFLTVDGGTSTELDLNGSGFGLPVATVIPVTLKAGVNTVQFANPSGYAANLDRIVVAETVGASNLSGTINTKQGLPGLRVWQLALNNTGSITAKHAEVNLFSVIQTSGSGACHPTVLAPFPLAVGNIASGAHQTIPVLIDFGKCSQDARFTTSVVFSGNNGADVGDLTQEAGTR